MANKTINVLMSLVDRFTAPMKKSAETVDMTDKKIKRTANTIRNFGKTANSSFMGLHSNILKFSGAAGLLGGALSVAKLKSYADECMNLANIQLKAETQLDAVLQNVERINERGADGWKKAGENLRAYASELQNTGVIGDEVTLAGMAQLATFQMTDDEIKTVSAGMLDLATKMKGYNVTQEDMIGYANMIGKAFQGQATALSRTGITMTDEQANIIKFGNASQRAAVIAEVLAKNVGGVNKAMAQTDQGKQQQAMNAYGDMMEEIGKKALPIKTRFLSAFAGILPSLQNALLPALDKLAGKFDAMMPSIEKFFVWLGENIPKAIEGILSGFAWLGDHMETLVTIGNVLIPVLAGMYAGFLAFNVISTVVGVITTLQTAIAGASTAMAIFNGVMLANPIGMISVAIAGLVAIVVALWKNWDKVCESVQKAWNWMGKVKDVKIFGGGAEPQHNALGTSYFRGGQTYVNEGNRGELINLPSGSQIVPHDKVQQTSAPITINLNIQGNVIGNDEFINQCGAAITQKLKLALGNV